MNETKEAELFLSRPEPGVLLVRLSGEWLLKSSLPDAASVTVEFEAETPPARLAFDCGDLHRWDTGVLVFLARLVEAAIDAGLDIDRSGLPEGINRLLQLAAGSPERQPVKPPHHELYILYSVGLSTISVYRRFVEGLTFAGDVFLSLFRLLRGKAQFRFQDLFLVVEAVGPNALPVVSLVSFLVGLILAYMGAAQLERVGAAIFIADLVAIGMVREIAALMTAIIMAGRTGAAFAAELGTMNVNEEIDAFKILGISVVDFLVLPRFLALVLMIPLLTLYSGLVGILAGMTVSVLVFDFNMFEYYQQTLRALELKHYAVGLIKSLVYGIVIALSGCLRGLQCGRSALAVGQATTSAVVTSIVLIVVTASTLTIMFYKLDI